MANNKKKTLGYIGLLVKDKKSDVISLINKYNKSQKISESYSIVDVAKRLNKQILKNNKDFNSDLSKILKDYIKSEGDGFSSYYSADGVDSDVTLIATSSSGNSASINQDEIVLTAIEAGITKNDKVKGKTMLWVILAIIAIIIIINYRKIISWKV